MPAFDEQGDDFGADAPGGAGYRDAHRRPFAPEPKCALLTLPKCALPSEPKCAMVTSRLPYRPPAW